MIKIGPILFLGLVLVRCTPDHQVSSIQVDNTQLFHKSVKQLTDIIVYDVFSPPVASRVYAYPAIAAYEIIQQASPTLTSLAGQINGLTNIPPIDSTTQINTSIAAIEAFTLLGRQLVFSVEKMDAFRDSFHNAWLEIGITPGQLEASQKYAREVVQHINSWMDKDFYKETRTYPKFNIDDKDASRWEPTPPAYIDGIEPHWNKIRPMVMDSASQFIPPPPPLFSIEPGSDFYKEAIIVYDSVNQIEKECYDIAKFWDCNPFVSHQKGHVMFATKKISPGGHWIGITGLACKKSGLAIDKTIEAYTLVSIGLFDAFISCWDEKYRSDLIRPETYINEYIDEDWKPILQTPPFPEHTSGHSVVSRTSAILLTQIFGNNFEYIDTVEEEFGLPARSYDSFLQASEEAAISRLYGGIHYMPAITEGIKQGEKVGKLIISRVHTQNQPINMSTIQ